MRTKQNSQNHFYSEIYSYYYATVTRLINLALEHRLDADTELSVISENPAFTDDLIDVSLLEGVWPFLEMEYDRDTSDMKYVTNIRNRIERPLTLLEKRWLRSAMDDPRIRLFADGSAGLAGELADVEPFFTQDDYRVVGTHADGDDYSDPGYIERFHTILSAIQKGKALRMMSVNSVGEAAPAPYVFVPEKLEYSEWDDKFRLYGLSSDARYRQSAINLSRIVSCELCEMPTGVERGEPPEMDEVTLELTNRHNSLERLLIELSHYDKRVWKIDSENDIYLIKIKYIKGEEAELTMLHLLSYAQYIDIKSPASVRTAIADRINRQAELFRRMDQH